MPVSHQFAYLLLICALLVVPGLLQRLRIPPPLTCFLLGLALILAIPGLQQQHDSAVRLLAALGVSTLFLYAGLEVELQTLRSALGPLSTYLLMRALSVAVMTWLATHYFSMGWQDAALLALCLLTSSTGFIIDSLDRFGLSEEERFWATNNAICGELLALAIMFVVLKAGVPGDLALGSLVLIGLLVMLPLAFRALARWILPYASGSSFSLLIMLGFAAAYITEHLGVEYLLGAFLAGLVARLMAGRVPAFASHDNLHALKLFTSFFLPFYFFSHGANVPADALSFEALGIGIGLTVVLVPLRALTIWAKRRMLGLGDTRGSLRVAAALTPTLIFTLVLATILRSRGAISDALFGGLLLYAGLTTLFPSLVLRVPFDVAPSPLTVRSDKTAEPRR